jgi:hypothetical protein
MPSMDFYSQDPAGIAALPRVEQQAPTLLQAARAMLDQLSADACDEHGLWDEYIALQEACNQAVESAA